MKRENSDFLEKMSAMQTVCSFSSTVVKRNGRAQWKEE